MPQQTIVAHFDDRSRADQAMNALVEAGVPRDAIRLLPEAQSGYQRTGSSYDHARDEGGFFSSLGDLFLPDEDRYSYAEGMSRGGVTVAVTTDGTHADEVTSILDRHGAVDMDEREASWRKEGWTGYSAASAQGATQGRAAATDDDRAIPIVEERLQVGKRQVAGGRVRVRSYVVETPVEEQVRLRQEHVHVERRPADRPARVDEDYRERTIEAQERSEEAVVSKEARVKEELVINKTAEERTQTVSDTVRRTEVEVEDERARAERLSGTTGSKVDPTRR